jgi:hypothetical protein
MKIDGFDPLKPPKGVEQTQRSQPPGGPSFADLLSGAMSGVGPVSTASGSAPTGPISAAPFIVPPVVGQPDMKAQAVSALESFISDLEMLQNGLANEEIPMERFQGLIDTLNQRKDEFAVMIGKLPDGELKSLLGQGLSMAVEQVNQYYANRA